MKLLAIFLVGLIVLSGCLLTNTEVKESFCSEHQMQYRFVGGFVDTRFCVDSDGVGHPIKCDDEGCFFVQEKSK